MPPLRRLLVVRFLLDVQFWFPTWFLFLLERGFSPLEAAAADAVFHAVIVLAEIPLGRVADRIGRKRALLLSCAGTTAVFLGIAAAGTVTQMVLVWGFWGLLWALSSGLDTSYAWDIAESGHSSISPAAYLGRTRVVSGMAGALSLLGAGFLLEIWAPLPYVLTAALGALAFLLALFLPRLDAGSSPADHTRPSDLRAAVRNPAVRAGIALGSVVLVAGISLRILFQPLGLGLGLDARSIGVTYTAIALSVAVGAWLATRIPTAHRGLWVPVPVFLMAATYLLTAATAAAGGGWWTMLVVLPLGTAGFGMAKTLTDIWMVDAVAPRLRASVLSLASGASGLIMVAVRPALVATADDAGHSAAFVAWGLSTAALGVVCLVVVRSARSTVPAN